MDFAGRREKQERYQYRKYAISNSFMCVSILTKNKPKKKKERKKGQDLRVKISSPREDSEEEQRKTLLPYIIYVAIYATDLYGRILFL